jgi:hypothetical protein
MMDALDILKKDWEKATDKFKSYSETDIYKMLHSQSTSIVKWIFYISIFELILWISLSLGIRSSGQIDTFQKMGSDNIFLITELLSYVILIYFSYLFYKNFKTINTTDSVKKLMNSIIHTRKTVTNYIKVFITYNILASLGVMYIMLTNQGEFQNHYQTATENGNETLYIVVLVVTILIFLILFALLLWGFYRIIYGILLKRLYKNYNELKKIDI